DLDATLEAVDAVLVGSILAALIAVLLVTPPLVRAGLVPLHELGDAMRGIGPHARGQRLKIPPTPELEPLQARFNEVLERMDAGLARERQFASAVAHETRTRLAELRTLVDVERRYPSGRPTEAVLDEIAAIGGDLEETVSGLLLLTRLEAGIESVAYRLIDLDALMERHAARMATTLERRRLHVSIEKRCNGSTLLADPLLLDIVVANLLGNAASHAPEGSLVEILVAQGAVTISNEAPDVDAKDIAHFGQRFWSTHQDDGSHTGLGLSLAGAAAAAMGLQLTFALDHDSRLHATVRRKVQANGDLSMA
ncbi:MAG: ATP-binding protein, partial [Rhodanobacteraceae bacterium]